MEFLPGGHCLGLSTALHGSADAARHRTPLPRPGCSFPYLSVGVLLPCAFCTALGIQTPLFAGGLFAWEVCDSLKLVWTQASGKLQGRRGSRMRVAGMKACGAARAGASRPCRTELAAGRQPALQLAVLIVNGMRPNELVVKRLAMIGSTGEHVCPCADHLATARRSALLIEPRWHLAYFCSPGAGSQHERAAGADQLLRRPAAVWQRPAAAAQPRQVAGAAARPPAHCAAACVRRRHAGKAGGQEAPPGCGACCTSHFHSPSPRCCSWSAS